MLVIWLKVLILLAAPFTVAGVAVSLALTRSPFPVAITYGVDLCGVAFGCLAVLLLLKFVDAASAMFFVAALAGLAGVFFRAAHGKIASDDHPVPCQRGGDPARRRANGIWLSIWHEAGDESGRPTHSLVLGDQRCRRRARLRSSSGLQYSFLDRHDDSHWGCLLSHPDAYCDTPDGIAWPATPTSCSRERVRTASVEKGT